MRYWMIAALLLGACQQQASHSPSPPPMMTFDGAQASDAAALRAHGERLTHVLGCTGCHGAKLEGDLFTKGHPEWGPLYASNLSVEVPEYSDAQLDGIIRHGTHPERKTVWGMPSQIFQHLGDSDYRALVAFLRSAKPVGTKLPSPQFSKVDKAEIASGIYKPAAQLVREEAKRSPIDLGSKLVLGRYITEVTCAECHGPQLEGEEPPHAGAPPNLIVVGGYSRAEFERLITQGIPTGNRKISEMMSGVATTRFSHLTRHERDALYAYLKARAAEAN
jgi:cytochrome c553